MREVSLTGSKPKTEKLLVHLTNEETGEVRELTYEVRKMTGKSSMQAQINLAEFAKDKKRDEIVGSLMIKDILAGTTPAGDAPDVYSILEELDGDQFIAFLTALTEAATGSTVTS